MEPLGTRQMKWIDFFLWNYELQSCRLKKIWWDGNGERFDNPVEDSDGVCYPMDHRFTFPGEVVFDLDLKAPYTSLSLATLADDIFIHLKKEHELPILCTSGGKGFHIHVFKSTPKIAEELCKDVVKRFHLDMFVGQSKPVDVNLLHKKHMIRMIGGRKYIGRNKYRFKSIINRARDFVTITNRDDVVFPSNTFKHMIKAYMPKTFIRESLNQIGFQGRGKQNVERSVLDTPIIL